ncbi:hypothetical protein CEV33_4769 [Brucella grignonensis]|uniref:Uncharacterized protein n=1 Tax=Brucella grignonensis TaxID=94627 RepID=A0A256G305_9HYPH|nr:hypothetical protein CEV33_4769 [Brucella grignonensis]
MQQRSQRIAGEGGRKTRFKSLLKRIINVASSSEEDRSFYKIGKLGSDATQIRLKSGRRTGENYNDCPQG